MEETVMLPQEAGQPALPTGDSPVEKEDFDSLIKGPYKEEYDKRVQRILQRRLKNSRNTEARYEELSSAIAQRYGVDPKDHQAVTEAVKTPAGQENLPQQAEQQYALWMQQAEKMQEDHPGFHMERELQNPDFGNYLRSGVSVEDAYFLTHRGELVARAMEIAARETEEKLTTAMATGGLHPRENGRAAQGAAVSRVDAAHMSKAQRNELIRRVQKGEIIRF